MTHATEGLLQAYLDGEIDSTAAAALSEHLDACALCSSELAALRALGLQTHRALAVLDVAPPMVRAQAEIAAARRGGRAAGGASLRRSSARGMAKAAMLLLALAGAGAAAIPESPVRRALETTLARVAQLFGGADDVAVDATTPAPVEPVDRAMPAAMAVMPVEGRVRVVLHEPRGEVLVTLQLVEASRALVETATEGQGVRFRTAPGRVEVSGMTAGEVTISIPRTVQNATLEIGGQVYAYKQGGTLRLTGPAGAEQGQQVNFRLGT